MNGSQLKHWRESLGMSQSDLAALLGESSPSTISRWERDVLSIPTHVIQRVYSKTKIELPLDDLHTLMEHARTTGKTLPDILADAIREYLASQSGSVKAQFGPTPLERTTDQLKAAEDVTPYPKN